MKGNGIKETAIQRSILDGLSYLGFCVWRNQQIPVPIRRGRQIVGLRRADTHTVGLPDILCLKNGHLYGLEVKTDTGHQSPEQKQWEEVFQANGATYAVVRSWEDVQRLFNIK